MVEEDGSRLGTVAKSDTDTPIQTKLITRGIGDELPALISTLQRLVVDDHTSRGIAGAEVDSPRLRAIRAPLEDANNLIVKDGLTS